MWLPAFALAEREVLRFFRQRSRLIGALGQPIIFWVLFGSGLRGSFSGPDGSSFQEYFFPGVAVMIVMFTAIFSTISIIEDRRDGFLQGVLVAPVPRTTIVLGKVFGGAILAVLQTVLFLVIGPLLAWVGLAPPLNLSLGWANLPLVLLFLTILGLALTSLGYCIAWPLDSTHGFHAVMSVFLMPMWLLSGAFFPPTGSTWISWVITVNPLTYGVAGLRRLLATQPETLATLPAAWVCWTVTILFGITCFGAAVWLTNRRLVLNSQ